MRCLPLVVLVVANACGSIWAASSVLAARTKACAGSARCHGKSPGRAARTGLICAPLTGGGRGLPAQVPDAGALDFRAVVAFSSRRSVSPVRRAGRAVADLPQSDAGRHWQLQFTNTNPKGFFDGMVFWDATHGVVLGDPIPDESGKLKFEVLLTDDGQNWRPVSPALCPMQSKAKALSPHRIRASRSLGQPPIPTSGSLPGARRRAFSTLPIAATAGRFSTLPWCMGRTRPGFFRSLSVTPGMA